MYLKLRYPEVTILNFQWFHFTMLIWKSQRFLRNQTKNWNSLHLQEFTFIYKIFTFLRNRSLTKLRKYNTDSKSTSPKNVLKFVWRNSIYFTFYLLSPQWPLFSFILRIWHIFMLSYMFFLSVLNLFSLTRFIFMRKVSIYLHICSHIDHFMCNN